MYCRKCGSKINDKAKFCDSCGEEVVKVKQRSDVQRFKDRQAEEALEKEVKKSKRELKREKKLEGLKNPYVIPALGAAIVAFTLGIFPYPKAWGIGTSLWLRIVILVIALLADYHCVQARRVNNMYYTQYRYKVQPKQVNVATTLAVITTMVALFSLFVKG